MASASPHRKPVLRPVPGWGKSGPGRLPGDARELGICVVIPCLNEASSIGKVVADFQSALPQATVMVFDNRSGDGSAEVAEAAGATVVRVSKRGKGNVMRDAFDRVKADVYVIVDADDTYAADEAPRLIEPVLTGEADMTVGTRVWLAEPNALTPLHRFGNRLIVWFLNFCFHTRLRDVLSGYRVLSGEMVRELPMLAYGFEVETELTLEALERGFRIREIPITYRARGTGSRSKLSAFRDGTRIVGTIFTLLRDYRPMTFFTAFAGILMAIGLAGGGVVVSGYLRTGLVERLPLAVLAAVLMVLAALFFLTGFIVSAINRRFAEMAALTARWQDDRLRHDLSQ